MAPQAESALITIPTVTGTAILYIPEIHHQTGNYFPELRKWDTSKPAIVADICRAQHDDVIRVIAVDLACGKSWDASKEIAQAVLDAVIAEYGHVPNWCLNFCQEHLGVAYVGQAEREAA